MFWEAVKAYGLLALLVVPWVLAALRVAARADRLDAEAFERETRLRD